MKKLAPLLFSFAFTAWAGNGLAQDCIAPDIRDKFSPETLSAFEAEVAQTPYAQGIIWTATRGNDRLIIAGSLHIPDPRLAPIRAALQTSMASADLLMLEITNDDQAALQAEIASNVDLVLLPDNQTLIELLPDDTWNSLKQMASDRGIPSFSISRIQPWLVGMMMSIPTCAMSGMVDGGLGLDAMLNQDANDMGLPVATLDDWQDVLDMMTSPPLEDQLEMLTLATLVRDIETEVLSSLLTLYFDGEVGAIWPMSEYALKLVPEVDQANAQQLLQDQYETLLVERNHKWMPVIEQATDSADDIVIVFGAAHLPGEDGILQLLENDGWTIAPYN